MLPALLAEASTAEAAVAPDSATDGGLPGGTPVD